MNLCLRFVTSTVMGLDLAVLMTAALMCLPVVSADEGEGEGGGGTTTIVDCSVDCHCNGGTNGEGCFVISDPGCRFRCVCIQASGDRTCISGPPSNP